MKSQIDTRKLVLLAVLTALVVLLDLLSRQIRFGTFSITLALAPIVVGSTLIGWWAGGFLGLAFGAVVLISGDAAPFMAISPIWTIFFVLLKGASAGIASGLVYSLSKKLNLDRFNPKFFYGILLLLTGIAQIVLVANQINLSWWGYISAIIIVLSAVAFFRPNKEVTVALAAITAPIVNTGVFAISAFTAFLPAIAGWGADSGYQGATTYIFVGLIGINFIIEFAVNIILAPGISRLVKLGETMIGKSR